MTEGEDVPVWLVERSYGNDEDLVTLVYATTDGDRHLRKQLSHALLRRKEITAGQTVSAEKLEPVTDGDEQERYATEASRMAEKYAPGEAV